MNSYVCTVAAKANKALDLLTLEEIGKVALTIRNEGPSDAVMAYYRKESEKNEISSADTKYASEAVYDGDSLIHTPIAPGSIMLTSTGVPTLIDRDSDGILHINRIVGSLLASGINGVTSVPATRTLTSAGQNFTTAGVVAGDKVVLSSSLTASCKDAKEYIVATVGTTTLTVTEDFPIGSQTGVQYAVYASELNCGTINYFTGKLSLAYPASPSSAKPKLRGSVLGSVAFPIALVSGDTLSANIDGTGATTATFTAVPGVMSGGAGTFVPTPATVLTLKVDAGISQAITFSSSEDSIEDCVTTINQYLEGAYSSISAYSLAGCIGYINDLYIQYNAHAVLLSSHVHASANLATAPLATSLATAITRANDIRTQMKAHVIEVSSVDECIALANDLRTQYAAHRVLIGGGEHGAADTVNVVSNAACTNYQTCLGLANNLKEEYNAHIINITGGVHGLADATNTITSPDATTVATLITLLNELRTDYEAHRILTAGGVHGAADTTNVITAVAVGTADIHVQDDPNSDITAPAATTTLGQLQTLVADLYIKYNQHIASTTAHLLADSTDVTTTHHSTLVITSDKKGTGSSIQVVSGTGSLLTQLGLSASTATGSGSNVVDIDAVGFSEAKLIIETAVTTAKILGTLDSTFLRLTSATASTGLTSSIVIGGTARTKFGFDASTHTGADTDSDQYVSAAYTKSTLIPAYSSAFQQVMCRSGERLIARAASNGGPALLKITAGKVEL